MCNTPYMPETFTPLQRVVVNLATPPKPVDIVAAAGPIEGHPDWLLVLVFRVGAGRTDLVAHAIMPTPSDWPTEEGAAEPSNVVPHPHTLEARRWLERWVNALPELNPSSGRITSSLVRGAPTSSLERWVRRYARQLEGSLVETGASGDPDRKPRGPRSGADVRYAQIAARYVELVEHTDTPRAQIADEFHLGNETIQNYLYRARERGLLTSPGQGRTGGQLTERARAILRDLDQEDEDGER